MYDRILFPTDGSAPTEAALEYALDVAETHGATLHVLHVADTRLDSAVPRPEQVIEALERAGEDVVNEAATRAADRDVSVVSAVVRGVPSEAIVRYAEDEAVDLIVVPTHGKEGVERTLLGSVTERVVGGATVPVITVNPRENVDPVYPCRGVLVPVDGSPESERGVTAGIDLARAVGAELHLLHVIETATLGLDAPETLSDETVAELEGAAEDLLGDAAESADATSVDAVTTSVVYGRAYRKILSYVDDHAVDAVVVGVGGQEDFRRYGLGGVSAKLVRSSPVPVMWIPERT